MQLQRQQTCAAASSAPTPPRCAAACFRYLTAMPPAPKPRAGMASAVSSAASSAGATASRR